MDVLITMYQLLLDHPDSAALTLAAFFLICGVGGAFTLPAKERIQQCSHPRNRLRFAIVFVGAALICLMFNQLFCLENALLFAALIILWILFLAVTIGSLRPLSLTDCRNSFLRKHITFIKDNTWREQRAYFSGNRPWYLFTKRERIEFLLMKAQFYLHCKEFSQAHAALCAIEESQLYDRELQLVRLQKAMTLLQMGNMHGAKQALDSIGDSLNDPMRWFGYSYIAQQAGDFEHAYEAIAKARGQADLEGADSVSYMQVYANYASMLSAMGNRGEALEYLRTAWRKARDVDVNSALLSVGSDLLVEMAACGLPQSECERKLHELEGLLKKPDHISNKMELLNVELRFRQALGDGFGVYRTLKAGYEELAPSLRGPELQRFRASVLQSAMNQRFRHEWLDSDIDPELAAYERFETLERLAVFKMYDDSMSGIELHSLREREPYKGLRSTIVQYVDANGRSDIADLLSERDPSDIYRFKALKLMEIWVARLCRQPGWAEDTFRHYSELARTLRREGLSLDAVQVSLMHARACKDPAFLYAVVDGNEVRVEDVLSEMPVVPPIPEDDGVHVRYLELRPPEGAKLGSHYADEMRKALREVVDELSTWRDDPVIVGYAIDAAHLFLPLGEYSSAWECMRIADNCGVSLYKLPIPTQRDVFRMKMDLSAIPPWLL